MVPSFLPIGLYLHPSIRVVWFVPFLHRRDPMLWGHLPITEDLRRTPFGDAFPSGSPSFQNHIPVILLLL